MLSSKKDTKQRMDVVRDKLLHLTNLGHVWQGTWRDESVILKDTFLDRVSGSALACEDSIAEEQIYRRVAHKHIFVELLDARRQTEPPMHTLVLERAVDDLFSILQRKSTPARQRLLWCLELTALVNRLHRENIAHLDISLENVVLARSGELRLIDAGCAGVFRPGAELNAGQFPRWDGKRPGKDAYMLPQIARGQPYDPKQADLFSLALALFYVLSQGPRMLWLAVDDALFESMEKVGFQSFVERMIRSSPDHFPESHLLLPLLPLLQGLMHNPPENWRLTLDHQLRILLRAEP
jgi:serine/threonine protein kinase